ncbi:MAG: hypothetical protein K1X75_10855 [Leptospirales bacterium]|nr:hypothetical protein [Leptospirales bacterium]
MAADNQNAALDLEGAIRVMSARPAEEQVQALESRGDFKFRGIIKVFDLIRDWSNSFTQRGILPSFDQLARDTELPEEKIRLYLLELLGRGSSSDRYIVYFPALQFIAGAGARITSMTVFCRPAASDGETARRYLTMYNNKNLQALEKWIGARTAQDPARIREQMTKAIQAGKVRETQARGEIVRLFYTDFDDNPERRKVAYMLYARPVIQKLIEERKLLYLQTELPGGRKINGVYFHNARDLEERFKALAEYYTKRIDRAESSEAPEPDAVMQRLRAFSAQYASLAEADQQVYDDLFLITPAITRSRKEHSEQVRRQTLEQALDQLAKIPRVADATAFRNVDSETMAQLRNVNGVLYAEYPYRGRITDFFLHKNMINEAVKTARDAFDQRNDDAQVFILSAMGLERFLDKDQYKAFLDLEQRVLFEQLPLIVRLWRMLTGRGKLAQREIVQTKQKAAAEQQRELLRLREEEARQTRKKLISERMSGEEGSQAAKSSATERGDSEAGGRGVEAPEPQSEEEKYEQVQEEQRARDILKKIVDTLDAAWDQKLLPNREYVLQYVKELDEDSLILFLKKYGRKEVLSFRIRNDKPEYVWPILISRRYLRRSGKKLLARVQEEADAQRKASMPNQEKFDVASSIEDFLGRVLPKLN